MEKNQKSTGQKRVIDEKTNVIMKKHNRLETWRHVAGMLALVVLMCATYTMILPAIAMDNQDRNGSDNAIMSILKAPTVVDPPIYYEIRTENGQQVLHMSNAPYDPANPQVYQHPVNTYVIEAPNAAEKSTITKIVLDTPITAPVNSFGFFAVFGQVTEIENLNNLNTSQTTNMGQMFNCCYSLQSLDLSTWVTDKVENIQHLFSNCNSLQYVNLLNWNTSNVNNMNAMFNGCKNLTSIVGIEDLDVKKVTSMSMMFKECMLLESLDLSGYQTDALTTVNDMFSFCRSLSELKLDGFTTDLVTDMSNMFVECSSLTELDVTHFNTGAVTRMDGMFYKCSLLTELDVTHFNTAEVINMAGMFSSCSGLLELDLSNFDTRKVQRMGTMFQNCGSLKALDLRNFETGAVTNMYSMFSGCRKLKTLDVSSFDTSNVITMSYMFENCIGLDTLNISNFVTTNVTDMSYMFRVSTGTQKLRKLDLSNFDTSNVVNMRQMFYGCKTLEELDISSFVINENTNVIQLLDTAKSLMRLEAPTSVNESLVIALPRIMINEADPAQVYGSMPRLPEITGSITLIPYDVALLLDASGSKIYFDKYLDGNLVNEAQRFDFGVFCENGTDTGIRVKNDAFGKIQIETKDLPVGRYYIKEIIGSEHILYDTVRYYFTIEEETVSTEIVYPSTEIVYLPIDEDYLNTKKYDLVANLSTVIAYKKGTNIPVKTMRAYCADATKKVTSGPVGTTTNTVYINPTDAQINTARGVTYSGPNLGRVGDAIKCILFLRNDPHDEEGIQNELWGLLNHGKEVDTSRVGEIPASFKWAIIKSPNNTVQPLIVPLWTTEDRDVYDSVEGDTMVRRTVKLETTDIDFRNKTVPEDVIPVQITANKTLTGGSLTNGQFSFELKDANGSVLQTKSNNSDGTIIFDPILYDADDYGKTFNYTISEVIGSDEGITYDETIYTVRVTIDSTGIVTYNMYRKLEESVTDGQEYAANHFSSNGNTHCISIDTRVAYCFNLDREWPLMDRVSPINNEYNCNEGYTKLENVSDQDLQNYSNAAVKEDILRVIYNGYPYDKAGLKAKYGLSDEQFRAVTQVALWYYTEGAYALVNDSMTNQERWNNTFMVINGGIGTFDNGFWKEASDGIKEKMYKCMADLSGALVKYQKGTGYYVNSYFYRGDTTSLQVPSGDLILDLFIHPTDGASIDEGQKIQNLLSIGTISPTGETITHEEVSEILFVNVVNVEKGNLVITKTIQGNVTEEEAKGAITFKVTAPDGTINTYTLSDFTKNSDGVYTLEFHDIELGEYIVEETTREIDGTIVTVTYIVNNGEIAEGNIAGVTVTNGNTSTVAFTNIYESLYELPETGGVGTKEYRIVGILLMSGVVMFVYKRRPALKSGKSMK